MYEVLIENTAKEDLADIYKEVADQIGVEKAYQLYQHFRGQQIAFPLKFYSRECVARKVCEEYRKSRCRPREIARKFGCSESMVRQILNEKQDNEEEG